MKKPDYLGHRKRLREKFSKVGLSGFSDYEVLEFILSYSIPRRDTKPIAKAIMRKFKNLSEVLNADVEELKEIPGVGKSTLVFLKFLKDFSSIYLESKLKKTYSLSSPETVYDYLKVSMKGKRDEELRAIFLSSRNAPLGIETLHVGTVDKSIVYPRKVIERALKHNAVSVILAHNHPGGSLKPSQDDLEITDKLKEALETVDISLLDHIIITNQGYLSLKEKGFIK